MTEKEELLNTDSNISKQFSNREGRLWLED